MIQHIEAGEVDALSMPSMTLQALDQLLGMITPDLVDGRHLARLQQSRKPPPSGPGSDGG